MAFQEAGACTQNPFKCLHIISSELYHSLIEKSESCDDRNSSTINTSSNSSPNIQNNFYPQDYLLSSGYNGGTGGFDDGDDDNPSHGPKPFSGDNGRPDGPDDGDNPGHGPKPQMVEPPSIRLPTSTSSGVPPGPQSDETYPQHYSNADTTSNQMKNPNVVVENVTPKKDEDMDTSDAPPHALPHVPPLPSYSTKKEPKHFIPPPTPPPPPPPPHAPFPPSYSTKKEPKHFVPPPTPTPPPPPPPHAPFPPSYPTKKEPKHFDPPPAPSYSTKKESKHFVPPPEPSYPTTHSHQPPQTPFPPPYLHKKEECANKPHYPPHAPYPPSYPPPPPPPPPPHKKEELMDTSSLMIPTPTPSTSKKIVVPSEDEPKKAKSVEKLKDEVKLSPHSRERTEIKKNNKTKRGDKKPKPELKKRILKVERNIPTTEEEPVDKNVKWRDYYVEHIPLDEDDEEQMMDLDNNSKSRKYPKLSKNRNPFGLKHTENIKRPTKKSNPGIRVRKDLFDKHPKKPEIRVRKDLFKDPKVPITAPEKLKIIKTLGEKTKNEITKRVRNFFAENKQTNDGDVIMKQIKKEKKHQTQNLKKSSSVEDIEMLDENRIKIENKYHTPKLKKSSSTKTLSEDVEMLELPKQIKKEKKHQTPNLKKSSSTKSLNEDVEMREEPKRKGAKKKHQTSNLKKSSSTKSLNQDVEMWEEHKRKGAKRKPQSTISTKRAIKKEMIENRGNTKLSHRIKKEMIAEEMNKKPIKPVISSKRKNRFPTHPTGPIKFIKKNKKTKDKKDESEYEYESESEDEDDKNNFKKKFYGSGFNMWKI